MRRRKRTRLEIDSDDLNHDSTTNTHSSISVPSGKRRRIITTCNTNSRRKNKSTNSNSVNSNSNYNHNEQKETAKQKIKNQKPLFESFKINKFEAKNYCNQRLNVLFGSKLISVQWLLFNENNSSDNKLYNAKAVRINIKFDNIQCVKYESKWGKILRLKLKKPPYFSEQACGKLRESHQKSAHFYTVNADPTNGFAAKYKNYEISLKTTSAFINKLKNGSEILKQLIEENENKQIDWDHNEMFSQNELKQISKNKNKNKNKDLCKEEVDKILISLGVKKEDVQNVNACLRAAISKKYVGITRGRFRLDINKGINQKMNKLSALLNGGCDYDENDECKCYMEITLKSLIEQPNSGGSDYENGNMEAAAKCKCMQLDDVMYGCEEPLMYVTNLCTNKPKLIDGKFHNHCEKAACNKCMGDYRNMHCYKCGVHDAWWGECDHCDDGSDYD